MKKHVWVLAAGCAVMMGTAAAQTGSPAGAGTPAPAAPGQSTTPVGPPIAAPAQAGPVQFPAVDPANITAPSPTLEVVNAFLRALWGLDENREWRVASIKPAVEQGFVRVEVYVGDKRQPSRVASSSFLITPDGKHAVSGDLAPFGAHPFQDTRMMLQQRADGPARGATSKDLELVEFADLQCPSCKAAQSTMDQLLKDFPQARIVYQNLPLTSVHPYALQAAEVGNCVRQAKGDPSFFVFAQKVYDTQADLTPEKADAALRAAVTAAAADPATVMTCASQPATRAAVDASVKLASDLGISGTPTLVINGRSLSLAQVPYAGLKKIIVYQGQLDGITVKEQPSLSTLK